MATLPRKCEHCGTEIYHYGACNCPIATLDMVDAERTVIQERLKQLAEIEKDALRRKLGELGVIGTTT